MAAKPGPKGTKAQEEALASIPTGSKGQEQALTNMPTDNKLTMQNILDQAKKDYESLKSRTQDQAVIARQEIDKLNDQQVSKIKKLKDEQKEQLNAKYQALAGKVPENGDFSTDQVNELKRQVSAMVDQFGDKQSDRYKTVKRKIEEFEGTAKVEVDEWFGEILDDIDAVLAAAVQSLGAVDLPAQLSTMSE